MAFLLFVGIAIFVNGWRKVPPYPFMVARKKFNRFIETMTNDTTTGGSTTPRFILKPGGDQLFILYPWFQSGVVVDCSDKNFDGSVDGVRALKKTAEGKYEVGFDLSIPYEITVFIDSKRFDKFVEACGGIEGDNVTDGHFKKVEKILNGIITEQMVSIAASMKSTTPKPDGTTDEGVIWEDFYKRIADIADQLIRQIAAAEAEGGLVHDSEIQSVRSGKGKLPLKRLGIKIKRFNLQEPKLPKSISDAIAKREAEEREKDAEKTEMDGVIDRINDAKTKTGLSPERAMDLVQSERGKARRIVHTIDQQGKSSGSGSTPVIVIQETTGKGE
ncbi:MAG: SPFH domain-containing protein [Candidatus Paceibacterota bacterium]